MTTTEDKDREENSNPDVAILDDLMQKFVFYCDINDPNKTLYMYENGIWKGEHYVRNFIQNKFSEIYGRIGNVRKSDPQWAIEYLKGMAMSRRDIINKPKELVPFKNHFVVVEDFEEEIDGKIVHHKQGEIIELSPRYFYLNAIPWEHKPNAKCSKFQKWLSETVQKEDLKLIQEMVGYCFYTAYPEAVFFILVGSGSNGKTLFTTLLSKLLGENNVTSVTLSHLVNNRFKMAELFCKLANISDDRLC
ncbi:MAG: hypothetical protein QXQ11_09125 [Candidatus Bathyarchaeia archaeon]